MTWSGTIRVQNSITIPSGVTVTVAAGATLQVAATATITIAGTLAIAGTKAQKVTIQGLATDDWAGMSIPIRRRVHDDLRRVHGRQHRRRAERVVHRHRQRAVARLSGTDLLTTSGGNIDLEYSWLGQPVGQSDTTHCDMHFEGGSPTLTIMHDNISTAAYGVMFYSGVNANFTYDNWFSNGVQVDATGAVTGDFSNGWFDKSPPSGTGLTASDLASAMIADAGPR